MSSELATEKSGNKSVPDIIIDYAVCNKVLYSTVGVENKIRICDIVLLIPNGFFLIFLFHGLGVAHNKLANLKCPIVKTVYTLVFVVCVVGVARSFVSMFLTASFIRHHADGKALKALWLLLRCCLLAAELSVIIFAIFAANLDSRSGVRRVLCITTLVAIVYISVQGVLEFETDGRESSYGGKYDLFRHGGMIFWFVSSFLFFLIYIIIIILPCTNLRQHHRLPGKKSFYWYCAFLAIVNAAQSIGSVLVYDHHQFGTCILDVTSFTYFALFAPLVYVTFLAEFFSSRAVFVTMTSSNPSYSYQPIPDSVVTQETDTRIHGGGPSLSITKQPTSDITSYGTVA